jgi:hypothetical protein
MALIDKLETAGEQATAAARESLEQAELNRDLNQAYNDLGRTTSALMQHGTPRERVALDRRPRIDDVDRRQAAIADPQATPPARSRPDRNGATCTP